MAVSVEIKTRHRRVNEYLLSLLLSQRRILCGKGERIKLSSEATYVLFAGDGPAIASKLTLITANRRHSFSSGYFDNSLYDLTSKKKSQGSVISHHSIRFEDHNEARVP